MKEKATRPEEPNSAEQPSGGAEGDELRQQAIEALKTVYDPEIPVNIYELGLIYKLEISPDGEAEVEMTLTSPMCPVAGSLPGEVEARLKAVSGIRQAKVELVWDPPWTMESMSEEAKLQLGLF